MGLVLDFTALLSFSIVFTSRLWWYTNTQYSSYIVFLFKMKFLKTPRVKSNEEFVSRYLYCFTLINTLISSSFFFRRQKNIILLVFSSNIDLATLLNLDLLTIIYINVNKSSVTTTYFTCSTIISIMISS